MNLAGVGEAEGGDLHLVSAPPPGPAPGLEMGRNMLCCGEKRALSPGVVLRLPESDTSIVAASILAASSSLSSPPLSVADWDPPGPADLLPPAEMESERKSAGVGVPPPPPPPPLPPPPPPYVLLAGMLG